MGALQLLNVMKGPKKVTTTPNTRLKYLNILFNRKLMITFVDTSATQLCINEISEKIRPNP